MKEDNPFTPELRQEAIDKITSFWGNKNLICTCCGNDQWTISDHFLAPWTFTKENSLGTTPAYPMVTISCRRCAHVIFFNAMMLGVFNAS